MLRNHLVVALRNLLKHRSFALINLSGLALGLACFTLIILFVRDELSYDRFHERAERIYRVVVDAHPPGAPVDAFAASSYPIGRTLRAEYPEVEAVARFSPWSATVRHGSSYFYDDALALAEPAFFDVFTVRFLEGEPAGALDRPGSIVLTERMREKYFGRAPALGRTLLVDDTLALAVTGVVADVPPNAHFRYDGLVSLSTLLSPADDAASDGWLNISTYTYLLLREGVRGEAFEAKIRDLVTRHFGEELRGIGFTVDLALQPLRSIHLRSDRRAELAPNGSLADVYVFSAIAAFVLLIASINFMNLTTARSMERAKEVGVRKAVGSSRGLLVRQFLGESVLMCLLALVLALGLVAAALPGFNRLADKEIGHGVLFGAGFLPALVGLALLLGVIAGSYPAFALSSFPTVETLRGTFTRGNRGARLRRGLVVFQFAVSVGLIACTLVVLSQLRFMQSRSLGFEREQVLVLAATGLPDLGRRYETFKEELLKLPGVSHATASATVPGRGAPVLIVAPEGLSENDSRRMQIVGVDHDFREALGLTIVAGRDLSREHPSDAAEGLLLNETAVEQLGWGAPQQALGRRIGVGPKNGVVVGVVQDFHQTSLRQQIEPLLLHVAPRGFGYVSLRLSTGDVPAALAGIQRAWGRFFPGHPFEYFFLDEDYDRQYRAETRLGTIFGVFSALAILIACLGLFGLAAFTAERRTKEIGVRKVLGASAGSIVVLVSKEFAALVVLGIALAVPAAYFAMRSWLEEFAYRTAIRPELFLLASLLVLAVAVLAVGTQVLRAALTDPARSLRYE